MGLPANAVLVPYQILLGGPQTRSTNEFLLPRDFIAALKTAPVQNISARIYHPEGRISQFQIGAKTVAAWQELFSGWK